MSLVDHFFDERMIYALGWTIIHSFWQILLIALLLKALLSALDSGKSGIRYTLTGGAILLITVAAAITFGVMHRMYLPEPAMNAVAETTVMEKIAGDERISEQIPLLTAITAALDWIRNLGLWIEMRLSAIVMLWMGGFIFFVLRFSVGVLYVQRLKHAGVKQPDPAWQDMAVSLSERMGLKKMVTVLESYVAKAPMVIGHFKPVILIPAGLFMGLSPDQAEAVLAHELAHIRRKDYLVNILKSILEVLFFYHPAIWWISSVFDREREHCCDDMTLKAGIDAGALSVALYRVAAFNSAPPKFAMAFFQHKYQLLKRIKRMNTKTSKIKQTSFRSVALTVLLLAITGIVASSSMPGSPDNHSSRTINVVNTGSSSNSGNPLHLAATPDTAAGEELIRMRMHLEELYKQNQLLRIEMNGMKQNLSKMHEEQAMKLKVQMKENFRTIDESEKQLRVLRKELELAHESGTLSTAEKKQFEKEIKLEHLRLEETQQQLQEVMKAYETEMDVQQDQLQDEFEQMEKELAAREMELEQKQDELLQKEKELKEQMMITERISDELLSDGLVQKGAETRVRLTDDALFINGEKQNAKYHQKYLKMYQDLSGQKFPGDLGFNFNVR